MSAQPEALRIATLAERMFKVLEGNETVPTMRVMEFMLEAAAELRRLHAENKAAHVVGIRQERKLMECEALLRQALEALETDDWQKKLQAAIDIRNHTSPKGATK